MKTQKSFYIMYGVGNMQPNTAIDKTKMRKVRRRNN